jgi:hypothetical protein
MAATKVFLDSGPLVGFLSIHTDEDFLAYRRKGRGVIPLLAPF